MKRRLLPLMLLLACSDPEPLTTRGTTEFVPANPATTTTAAERRSNDPFHQTGADRRVGSIAPGQTMQVAPTEMASAMEPERDLAAELRLAAGSPMSCGDMGGATGDITVPLSATVSLQGRVTRASVGGPLPAANRDCMRRKIEGHRFSGPVPGAPRTITASIELRGTAAPTKMQETPTTGFALQQGQTAITGPAGMAINPNMGTAINSTTGTPINPTMGTPITGYGTMTSGGLTIMGPSGTPITTP